MVDADVLAREVVAPGTPALAAIRKRFGPDAVRRDGTMDRIRVGQIVFKDKRARLDLEAIIHPAVVKAINDFFAALPKRTPFAVADIPLLFETGRDKEFDAVVVVACPRDMQLQRLMERNKLSKEDAERRLAAQLPIDQKVKKATYVINDGRHLRRDRRAGRRVDCDAQGREIEVVTTGARGACHISTVASFAGAIRSSTNEFHSWQCGHCHSRSVLR